ncbi:diaminobutyrate acetyltransferase [Paenibacillaceae bacterium]|nr:diaminobutyrate acetyltransferase [Paenibacillaceae bacterium]
MQSHTLWSLRVPSKQDGAAVWELIRSAGTLDVNSPYCYILLCDLFRSTCVIAEQDSEIVGFLSACSRPDAADGDVLFIWQVAVAAPMRGKGLALAMLTELLNRRRDTVRWIEATVSPSNIPSRRLFQSFAAAHGCNSIELPDSGYGAELFPSGQQHEDEPVLRLGPFQFREEFDE